MKPSNASVLKFSAYGTPDAGNKRVESLFYPTYTDKFITVCLENDYKLWNEVFELVIPFLTNAGIGIVSLSFHKNPEKKIRFGQSAHVNLAHAAYLLENSLLHVCASDWTLALAQHNGVEAAFVNTGPVETIYNHKKYDSGISDLGRPEKVSQLILDRLGLKGSMKIDTLLIGDSYDETFIEMIPDFVLQEGHIPASPIGVRCDLFENWNFVRDLLSRGAKPTVFANSLPPQSIMPFLKGINKLNIYVEGAELPLDRVRMLEDLGINYAFLTRNEDIPDIKYHLFDFKPIQFIDSPSEIYLDKLKKMSYNTHLKARRSLVSKDGTFLSVYHWRNRLNVKDPKGSMLMDGAEDPDFISESDLFLYYKLLPNE